MLDRRPFASKDSENNAIGSFAAIMDSYTMRDAGGTPDIINAKTYDIFKQLTPLIRRREIGFILTFNNKLNYDKVKEIYNAYYMGKRELDWTTRMGAPFILNTIQLEGNESTTSTTTASKESSVSSSVNSAALTQLRNEQPLQDVANNINSSTTTTTSTTQTKASNTYIRIYPVDCQIIYPTRQIRTAVLSNNEILQTSSIKSNLRIMFRQNIALNTLDTQWLDAYKSLFDLIIESGNPSFDLMCGNYLIKNCFIENTPLFIQNFQETGSFDLQIVSSIRDLEGLNNV